MSDPAQGGLSDAREMLCWPVTATGRLGLLRVVLLQAEDIVVPSGQSLGASGPWVCIQFLTGVVWASH